MNVNTIINPLHLIYLNIFGAPSDNTFDPLKLIFCQNVLNKLESERFQMLE